MPKSILLDEIHVTVFAPAGLRKAGAETILRTLCSKGFQRSLWQAVREAFRRHPSLKKTKFRIDR